MAFPGSEDTPPRSWIVTIRPAGGGVNPVSISAGGGLQSWTDSGGRVNLLDGFLLDGNLRPLATPDVIDATQCYGNFALFQHDTRLHSARCYVDAAESRNVFYSRRNGEILISNDLNLIRTAQGGFVPDMQSLYGYFAFGYLAVNERTLFAGISKLKAGQVLEIETGQGPPRLEINTYWRPQIGDRQLDREEAIEEVQDNLTNYLRGALSAAKRPMTTLTSGTDSNLFYYILERNLDRLPSITHAFDHEAYDEFKLIKHIRPVDRDNYKVVSYADVLSYLSDAIAAIGQPINGLASMGEFRVYRHAHNCGADALITGTGDYVWVPVKRDKMVEMDTAPRSAYAGDGTLLRHDDYLAADFTTMFSATPIDFYSTGAETQSTVKRHLLDQVFVKRTPHIAFDHAMLGRKFGLQCIEPFVERKTLEFCFSLADDSLFFDDQPKSLLVTLLKKLYGKPFPPSLKMNSPQRELVRGPYRNAILDLIDSSRLRGDGIIDGQKLTARFREYYSQPDLGNSYFIWKFIVAEIWYRLFIHGEKIDLYPQLDVH